jgi:carbamate kinase
VRYRDLKEERDAAIARALEAERLSMKSEFDRVTAEFEREKQRLQEQVSADVKEAYLRGFCDGTDAMANDIKRRLELRTALLPKRPDACFNTTEVDT